jgi:hypothetical protein
MGGRVDHQNRRPCPRHAATPLFAIPPLPGIPAGRDAPCTRRGGGDRAVVRAMPLLSSAAAARAECGHRVGGRSSGGGGGATTGAGKPVCWGGSRPPIVVVVAVSSAPRSLSCPPPNSIAAFHPRCLIVESLFPIFGGDRRGGRRRQQGIPAAYPYPRIYNIQ